VSGILDGILNLDPVWLLATAGLLVFAEDAVFIGFVIPGETAAVLAGVGSGLEHVPLWTALVVVVLAAIVGDSVGYEVGQRWLGPALDRLRFLDRHRPRIERAQDFLRRRGGVAVFLGRFTAFFRAMMPALAGASRMHYPRFLAWNAAGGIVWGTIFVSLGYLAGDSYHRVEKQVGRGVAVALVVLVVAALVVGHVRRKRAGTA
jgi:membrane protein DedA with SNARE-associated domain